MRIVRLDVLVALSMKLARVGAAVALASVVAGCVAATKWAASGSDDDCLKEYAWRLDDLDLRTPEGKYAKCMAAVEASVCYIEKPWNMTTSTRLLMERDWEDNFDRAAEEAECLAKFEAKKARRSRQ